MEYHNKEEYIRNLLELYFDGEATLEQESELAAFFAGSDIPSDLAYAKAMFAGFTDIKQECCEKEISLDSIAASSSIKRKRSRLSKIYASVSIAAAILVAGILMFTLMPEKETVYCYLNGEAVTDQELAVRQVEMTLRILESSAKASAEGISTVKEVAKPIERLDRMMQLITTTASEEDNK